MAAALAAKVWLERNPNWIVVFDNAPGPAGVRDWLPAAAHGQILITSRWSAGWDAVASSVEVSVFDRGESLELLSATAPDADLESMVDLADLLGDLPLALAQAAAYVQATGISFAGYLERYQAHAATMGSLGELEDYEAAVATTWSLAMEQLEGDEAARVLMWTTAFLAPERAPRDLFADNAFVLSVFEGEERLLKVDAAVAALRRFSIINASGEGVEMHRLVQAVIRGRLSPDEAKNWNGAAQAVLAGLFPVDVQAPESWSRCDSLLPHGLVVARWATEHANETEGTAGLLYALGRYQAWRLELVSAVDLLRGALRVAEDVALDRSAILSELAEILTEAGEHVKAARLISEALAETEERHGMDSLPAAGMLRNKGSILRRSGDVEGARRDLLRAVGIAQADLDGDDPRLVGFLVNLANAEPASAALALHERAVSIVEQQPNVDPHLLAVALTNLGATHHRLGELEPAGECLRRAVTTYEEAYGPDFPRIAGLFRNLGVTLREQNRLTEAEDALRRALQLEEASYGPDDMRVATTLVDLADVLQRTDGLEAERLALRAVEIARGSRDPTNNLPVPLARLGDIQRDRGALDDAETALREALGLVVARYGERSPESAHIRVKMGAVLRRQNRVAAAIDELNLAVELLEDNEDKYQLAAATNNLGNALDDAGRHDDAIAALCRSAVLTEALFGNHHPQYASALVNLAIAYQRGGDALQASQLVEKAIEIDPNRVQPG
jgi:tetratricopeptide (TPR) repeat protein